MDKGSGRGTRSGVQLEVRSWAEEEVASSEFKDERLGKRFQTLLQQLTEGIGKSIPFACQDGANTKCVLSGPLPIITITTDHPFQSDWSEPPTYHLLSS